MRRIILDTNVLIALLRNPYDFAHLFRVDDVAVLTPTVIGEFASGITATRHGEESRRAFEEFLRNPAVEELPTTSSTALAYAQVYRSLKNQGTPIPTNDIWIAAAALEHGYPLLTRDRHFRNVQGINLL